MKYLAGYSATLRAEVEQLIAEGRLGALLTRRYPVGHASDEGQAAHLGSRGTHGVRDDRALFDYVMRLRGEFMRNAEPLNKVMFDNKLQVIRHALGTHTTVSRVQGSKLKSKREIRIASLFKEVPEPLLRMIVVHELAHLKEREHDKAFYQLCLHMEPDYHRLELDLRLYLTHLDVGGEALWRPASSPRA
ncbi:putative metal dependent hydrolase [Burkholderiales bacterium 8X]|nr:putative metal dependent hydrolase [Burkholderiales bacterium 8X]